MTLFKGYTIPAIENLGITKVGVCDIHVEFLC
jgi:hypothetical protein